MSGIETDKPDLVMDSLLKQAGTSWTEDSCPDSERFLATFESALRGASTASQQKVRRSIGWRRWWVPALASAVCAMGLLVFLRIESPWTGAIVFHNGSVIVKNSGGEQDKLGDGSVISSGPDGDAILALDSDRIKVFLNHGTEVSVQTASSIRVEKGEIWVRVQPDSGFFGIDTPHGFIHVQGTTFGVVVSEKKTNIEIVAGKVLVGTGQKQTRSITPGTAASLSMDSSAPILYRSQGDVTPAWAEELFNRAVAAQALAYFPSAAPRAGQ